MSVRALLLLLVLLARPVSAEVGAAPAGRRYLLAVGANRGDAAEPELRYAERDAERFTAAMLEVGGVRREDALLLRTPDAPALARALGELGARLRREAGAGDQLVLYLSGHADEGELHLAGTRYPLRELTAFVREAPVGVALLVVDSCRSGAVTRLKGLRPVAGTSVQVEAPEVSGRVVIGSSGADEYAQESDALQGSHFTHHLTTALRGAGDASGDGKVTLQEAYDYAYARTVESTFATAAGPQHPTFRVDLRGRGELVLSEPGRARGRLVLASPEPGEYLVVSLERGEVAGQLVKAAGPAVFALEPGAYRVQLRASGELREARVEVPDGGEAVLREAGWSASVPDAGLAKGPSASLSAGLGLGGPRLGLAEREAAVRLGLGAAVGTGLTPGVSAQAGVAVRALALPAGGAVGLAVELGGRAGRASAQGYRENAFSLRAGPAGAARWGRVEGALALEAGPVLVVQDGVPGGSRRGLEAEAGVAPSLSVALAGPLSAWGAAFGGGALLRSDSGLALTRRGELQAGVGWAW